MDATIISALLALAGSLVGTFAGIITSSKLTNFRLQELEKKQDKHNQLIERMYKVEERVQVIEEREKVTNHRISDLEAKQK